MKHVKFNLITCLCILSLGSGTVIAQDSVRIGSQVWMAKNLNVDRFRNGDPIAEAKTPTEWTIAGRDGVPAWCYYNNDSTNGKKHGKLYNWHALNDPRGLAPAGWRIPGNADWIALANHLGTNQVAGNKMKSTTGWDDFEGKNGNGTNESGFQGYAGGYRNYDGSFDGYGTDGHWWSNAEYSAYLAWFLFLNNGYIYVGTNYYFKDGGFSVRCLKE